MRFQCVVLFWGIVFLYRLTLMVTLTLASSWVLRPSLQKLPAPPQPHTSQRSVNQQTPQSIRWSTPPLPSDLPSCVFTFCFYWRYCYDGFALSVQSKPSRPVFLCVWWFYALGHQMVKGGISETRIEKRIVISGDADIDHDQVSYSFSVL